MNAQYIQRQLTSNDLNDPLLKAIAAKRRAVADKFIGETPPKSGLKQTWNLDTMIKVATGDVLLLLQLLDIDGSHDVVGDTQWRVTAEALNAGKPVRLAFGRAKELTLAFRPLGAAPAADDALPSRAAERFRRRLSRKVSEKVRGSETDTFVLALMETSWRARELGLHDALLPAALLIDAMFLPIVVVSDGATSLSDKLPSPPNTVRIDHLRFEVVQGRRAAADRATAYLDESFDLPAFPDGMPRLRRCAVVARHADVADAQRAAEQLRVRREALLRRR